MSIEGRIPHVGAPDPELRTSPIVESEDVEEGSLDDELEQGACFFNNVRYSTNQYVRSGDEFLCCTRGVWIRKGEAHP